MAKKKSQSQRKKEDAGVEAFDEDDEDLEESDVEEDDDEEETDDDESDDDDSDDDDDEDDDDEEDDSKDEVITDVGFAPFIVSENQEWEIGDIIASADVGDIIYLYAPPELDDDDNPKSPAKWYKLVPVSIGELLAVNPEG